LRTINLGAAIKAISLIETIALDSNSVPCGARLPGEARDHHNDTDGEKYRNGRRVVELVSQHGCRVSSGEISRFKKAPFDHF
jgi:hypothetical protein